MRLIDYDPLTGESVSFVYNHDNDTFTIKHSQDCEAIVEDNKRALLENDHNRLKQKDIVHWARIPNIVILEWKQKFGVDYFNRNHERAWMQLLERPEYKYLKRTTMRYG